ncbi:sensor histidine kinase [Serinicoccus hydrothermalis]|uniref:Sensor histidine kinase n=1 Tax=Serinicoccus hydrothermalis TaxID=1758689 RepID=A0A1B1NAB7_9MICO|nr:sensor histidine kinase [Serinicoccus hydrothermalis]ANS78351.1 sensor histidine kinase [Serinicoccus hydrothermalis]
MSPTQRPADAWSRWGWLFGGIWLVFFIFPLIHIWTTPYTPAHRLVATALVAAFMVAYVLTVRRAVRRVGGGQYASAARGGLLGLGAMVAVAIVLATMIGPNALTAMPFIVGVPVFFLPWRGVWTISLGLLGLGMLTSALIWGVWPTIMFWGISALVLTISVLSRYLEEQQESALETESQLALTEERERVARDVHDVLGHSLTVVTVKTELARRLVDADPERAKQEMGEVQDIARQALAEIRATVGGLRVARLADEVEAADVALRGAGIDARLPDDVLLVDPRHRITLAWVLREAVTNVVRHSHADTCVVELGDHWLRVSDDGRGVDGTREGNGIRGLRERVEQAGGSLTLGPGPDGAGTTVEVKL